MIFFVLNLDINGNSLVDVNLIDFIKGIKNVISPTHGFERVFIWSDIPTTICYNPVGS